MIDNSISKTDGNTYILKGVDNVKNLDKISINNLSKQANLAKDITS
ncbi:MAG: hypothetical protein RR543_00690 [Erysipelotrichales bacterium]